MHMNYIIDSISDYQAKGLYFYTPIRFEQRLELFNFL